MNLRLLPLLLLCGPAFAVDDAALAQCAAMADAAQRLACYDALAGRPAQAAGATTPPVAGPEHFGKPIPMAVEAPSLRARIAGPLTHWKYGHLIRLDNGQVWKVMGDESGAYYPDLPENLEVEITHSFFGSYWMELLINGRKIKVKRIS